MNNIMSFGEYSAAVSYDAEIGQFRGEFLNLNGGADFYANDIDGLKREGQISLNEYLLMCEKKGISPKRKHYSGKLSVRIDPVLHEKAARIAQQKHKSLSAIVNDALAVYG
ncbi:MAG: type II toxin-antitoxin system HicB family antitoxin [Neisseriaceae bacterium]|nr:type II toxin-antitoxin system HicB family antitoxin [Neisseriaceae bacterium]MBO7554696.1 type II toxin-antitoxin system HicB family antitoxin [Neisseriaceae bacterium]MBQ9683434.1 type II toxin-antitoxin system HicB family antitoxin [Neisseriaceae bacterium]MBR7002236.1 type II toxin-antitoxin system HicB family antitoxin [Neisseriaceae bacterium]